MGVVFSVQKQARNIKNNKFTGCVLLLWAYPVQLLYITCSYLIIHQIIIVININSKKLIETFWGLAQTVPRACLSRSNLVEEKRFHICFYTPNCFKPEKIEMFLEDSKKKSQYRQNTVPKASYHVVVWELKTVFWSGNGIWRPECKCS